jgi:hypothetical protein
MAEEMTNENTIPNKGAIKINITILITPADCTAPKPELATAAPTRPPTRVCEELDGRPQYHVTRFQVIAATRAAPITVRLIASGLITPVPMVVATFKGKTLNAIKLKNEAITTAANGDNTFVETTVAIELAESWNPLMKSKTRTSPITMYKNV